MRAQTDIELTERLVETPTFNRFALAGSCAKEEAVLVLESAVFAIESELVLNSLDRSPINIKHSFSKATHLEREICSTNSLDKSLSPPVGTINSRSPHLSYTLALQELC